MGLKIDPLKCTGCGACEVACSWCRDEVFTTMRSSTMMYREEKSNYFGLMVKREEDLILGRPDGLEIQRLGETPDDDSGAAAKPILMREVCDNCYGCIDFCPTGCLSKE